MEMCIILSSNIEIEMDNIEFEHKMIMSYHESFLYMSLSYNPKKKENLFIYFDVNKLKTENKKGNYE